MYTVHLKNIFDTRCTSATVIAYSSIGKRYTVTAIQIMLGTIINISN